MLSKHNLRRLGAAGSALAAAVCLTACYEYEFDKKVKFCEGTPLGKVCTPSLRFEGTLFLDSYTIADGIPTKAEVGLDLDKPFNTTISRSVGLGEDDGKVCYNASKVDGIDLELCFNAINVEFDWEAKEVSGKIRLSVVGGASVQGVGISEEVNLYTTPTIVLPLEI